MVNCPYARVKKKTVKKTGRLKVKKQVDSRSHERRIPQVKIVKLFLFSFWSVIFKLWALFKFDCF